MFVSKNLGPKKFVRKKIDVQTKFWIQRFWVHKIVGPKNLQGPKKISIKKVKACQKLGPKRFVKIGSVTAETFLIWTNVARTNVALTNVTVTVGIC